MEIILLLMLLGAIALGVFSAIKGSTVYSGIGLVVLALVVALMLYKPH